MDKPETPAVNSGLPEDVPLIEDVDVQSDDMEAEYGGEIIDWPMLGYTHLSFWWPSDTNTFYLIFFL